MCVCVGRWYTGAGYTAVEGCCGENVIITHRSFYLVPCAILLYAAAKCFIYSESATEKINNAQRARHTLYEIMGLKYVIRKLC